MDKNKNTELDDSTRDKKFILIIFFVLSQNILWLFVKKLMQFGKPSILHSLHNPWNVFAVVMLQLCFSVFFVYLSLMWTDSKYVVAMFWNSHRNLKVVRDTIALYVYFIPTGVIKRIVFVSGRGKQDISEAEEKQFLNSVENNKKRFLALPDHARCLIAACIIVFSTALVLSFVFPDFMISWGVEIIGFFISMYGALAIFEGVRSEKQ